MRHGYEDRADAGRVLAATAQLQAYAGRDDVVVLGLPRGGVPVALPIARALRAPLDVVLVRKLGLPEQPELAMGAVASIGGTVQVVRNDSVVQAASERVFEEVHQHELVELRERERRYRAGRPPVVVTERVVILVDDGLATGASMRAAVAAVRAQRPARIVVAVPVGAEEACADLAREADEVVCAWIPQAFWAVGQAYADFRPTSDEEVVAALHAG